jgi:hypothetical protein
VLHTLARVWQVALRAKEKFLLELGANPDSLATAKARLAKNEVDGTVTGQGSADGPRISGRAGKGVVAGVEARKHAANPLLNLFCPVTGPLSRIAKLWVPPPPPKNI